MSESPRRLIIWAIVMTALAVGLVTALVLVREALVLIYIAVLMAIGFSPLVRAIEQQRWLPVGTRRLPRWLAILVVYVVIVGALVGTIALIAPPLVSQGAQLWQDLPRQLDRFQDFLMARGLLSHRITLEEAVRNVPSQSTDVVGAIAALAGSFAAGVFAAVTILILAFYLMVESESIFAGFARLFARRDRPRVAQLSSEISGKVSAWMMGQLILAGTIGTTSAIGLYLIGVPYFYVLALISAIGEIIPVVGPILAAIPAIAAGFSVSPRTALYVVIFYFLQQQAENHLLVPRIMSRQVGVSSVVVIVALLLGSMLFGIVGAVLSIPTAAILQVLVQELLDERDRQDDTALS